MKAAYIIILACSSFPGTYEKLFRKKAAGLGSGQMVWPSGSFVVVLLEAATLLEYENSKG